MTRGNLIVAVVAIVVGLVFVGSQLREPRGAGAFDYAAFGRLPVTAEGRIKPIDTVARTTLLTLSGRQTAEDAEGREIHATQWLLDTVASPSVGDAHPVFRVDHPQVKALIPAAEADADRKRFSWNEIAKNGPKIQEAAEKASEVDEAWRDAYHRQMLDFWSHLMRYQELQSGAYPHSVPPSREGEEWQPLAAAAHAAHTGVAMHPNAIALRDILTAYANADAGQFNARVAAYAGSLDAGMMRTKRLEALFNRVAPFYQGTVLYTLALVVGFGSVLLVAKQNPLWSDRLRVAAVTLVVLAFAIHTLAILARMYLQGRPPVTNLYSSAVFIGWVAVLLGLFIEWGFRNVLGTLVAAAIGCATLIVAHNLADGDTMQMMQAVLDSNFWLATHVITITIGYSGMFLAGAIGIAYIFTGVYTRALSKDLSKTLTKMMYGTIAFALFFSFIGTVLGGIWADQSWGRFWGWDPKENGAILIVLWTAMILHARWGGMIQSRGIAVLAVGGNIITSWSWFGTNMLGVGLHSYGFMDSAVFWLLAFVVSQLTIMAVGCMPLRAWASFAVPAVPREAVSMEVRAKPQAAS